VFNANTFANKARGAQRPTDREKNYAFSFGAPLWVPKLYNGHNKTFFYTSYERYSITDWTLGAPNKTVPVPEFYQGDFSACLAPRWELTRWGVRVPRGAISIRQLSASSRAAPGWVTCSRKHYSGLTFQQGFPESERHHAAALPADRKGRLRSVAAHQQRFVSQIGPAHLDHYLYSIKVDHNFSSAHRLSDRSTTRAHRD